MAAYELEAEARTTFGKKVKNIRNAGLVPAEIYGRGFENQSIQVDGKILSQLLEDAGSTNLITIKVGSKKPVSTLARNIQYSPVKRDLLHVDFYAVIMDETVSVTIPIHLVGESVLVKDEDAVLVTGINSLDIEALPADLPESVEVDLTVIESFNDSISVADLSLPEGVIIHSSLESMIATYQPPRLVEEEEEDTELLEEGIEGEEGEVEEDEGEEEEVE
jgi:large subunit ribosomal protein L25